MLKSGINHCAAGMMSVCKAADSVVDQIICDFNPGKTKLDCPHLRKDMGNHCDNIEAQTAVRDKSVAVSTKPLTEEDVFDLRHNETYPTY